MILVNSFTYSAIMYLCAIFVNSEGAWSGLGTVIGTLVGFLGGIYLPVGNLSDGLADFLSCTPVMIFLVSSVIFAGASANVVA